VISLTIDIGLMTPPLKNTAMTVLQRWEHEGKLALIAADRRAISPDSPAPQRSAEPRSNWAPSSRSKKMAESGNAKFKSIAGVLFPRRDAQKLNMTEINQIAHLIKHHSSKNDIFVTENPSYFAEERYRELLKVYFGIVVMSPEETVGAMERSKSWN